MSKPVHLHDVLTGQHLTFMQSARDTAGALLRVEVSLDPGGWVPRHAHLRQDERVEVLAGTLSVRVGRTERTLVGLALAVVGAAWTVVAWWLVVPEVILAAGIALLVLARISTRRSNAPTM